MDKRRREGEVRKFMYHVTCHGIEGGSGRLLAQLNGKAISYPQRSSTPRSVFTGK